MSGYVYLIGMDAETHKIGVSMTPNKRRLLLQDAHPRDLTLARKWHHADPFRVEALAHKALAGLRLNGEWFAVCREEAEKAIRQAIEDARLVNKKPLPFADDITKKGARMSAKKRRAASDAKIALIKELWPRSSKEWPTATLLEMTGLSRNTVQERLGRRPVAQFLYQRALKRRKAKQDVNDQAIT